ncbi:MAG: hypothetical protein KIS92_04800 [Planctomycetota bacterium]|nr:hypothetical protein [Planctomycetota bacterium]
MTTPLPLAKPLNAVRLDGRGRDPVWARGVELPAFTMQQKPEPEAIRTKATVLRAGPWLLARLEAREPEGLVAREGVHGGDPWFDDELGIEAKGARAIRVYVNPFGTVWCQVDGKAEMKPFYEGQVLACARIEDGRWTAEIALDLRALDLAGNGVQVCAVRQRQARGTVPYFETVSPGKDAHASFALGEAWKSEAGVPVEAAPPEPVAGRATLTAARVDEIPAGREAWLRVPPVLLRDETGRAPADPAFQTTVLRAAVTRETLALHIFSREAHPTSIESPGKELWKEDNLELFFGPEGYPYLQLITGPCGKVQAALGQTGGKRVKSLPVPAEVKVEVAQVDGGWSATVLVPFAAHAQAVGIPVKHPEIFPWRVQVSRYRPARGALGQAQQLSILAVTNSATAHCPLRYALMRLAGPSAEPRPDPERPASGLPAPVLDAKERERLRASELTAAWAGARRAKWHAAWQAEFEKIQDAAGWKTFSDKARAGLRKMLFPGTDGRAPERTPLNAAKVYEKEGQGFKVVGLIFETRPGLLEPATLFVPAEAPKAGEKRAALIVLPAHHTPRHSNDLYYVGENLARAGAVALLLDTVGSGECSTVARWEHKTYQRCETGVQLALAGEEISGAIAWAVSRAADYLLEEAGADPARLGVLGGVAGGGDLAGVAAAFDERITLCVPFNFSNPRPFGGYYDFPRALAGSHVSGLNPWMVDALVAPRHLIQAQEFAWTDPCKDAYARFEKVYGWLGAPERLNFLHGGENTHATHFNTMHRRPMYAILNAWWKLALPTEDKDEFKANFNAGSLECFGSEQGRALVEARRAQGGALEWHAWAKQAAAERLAAARKARGASKTAVREALERVCGPLAPEKIEKAEAKDAGSWRGAAVSAFWLPAEARGEDDAQTPGLAVWLLQGQGDGPRPLAVGVAQAGKARFLDERAAEVERLLKAGVSVALIDLRACGETSPGASRSPESPAGDLASMLWMQHDSLPARQLKDLRTALAFLAKLDRVDPARVALWGEGLTEPNASAGAAILFDETGFRQSGPVPMQLVEPLGGWLAVAGALFEFEDAQGAAHRPRVALARGTLAAWRTVLDRRYHYLPFDALIPGLLRELDAGDAAQEAAANGVTVIAEDLRDGSNRAADPALAKAEWGVADYSETPSEGAVTRMIEILTK